MSVRGRTVDRTYHPRGGVMSPSLQRARKPFLIPNIIVGSCVALFTVGVYAYSISAVKQDDFSDVEDLLPPLEQRKSMKSIEDELREHHLSTHPPSPHQSPFTTGPSGTSTPLPSSSSSSSGSSSGSSLYGGRPISWLSGILPRRLDDLEWVRRRGLVESGNRGNVLVWGAPQVDAVGRMGDVTTKPGLRTV